MACVQGKDGCGRIEVTARLAFSFDAERKVWILSLGKAFETKNCQKWIERLR